MGEDDANKGGSRRSKRADDGLHGTRRRSYSLALRPSPHCADAKSPSAPALPTSSPGCVVDPHAVRRSSNQELSAEDIQRLFHLRQTEAAQVLGMSLTALKRACRRAGYSPTMRPTECYLSPILDIHYLSYTCDGV